MAKRLTLEVQSQIEDLLLQLQEVRDAKRVVITGGQSYSIRGRSLNRVSLADLRREENAIINEIARLSNPPGRTRRMVYWEFFSDPP